MSISRMLLVGVLVAFACAQQARCQTMFELQQQAEAGDAEAMFRLGTRWQVGSFNHPSDFAQSLKWYRAAAEKGNAKAMHYLGAMYWNGFGVPRDRAMALQWFRRAAENGDPFGMIAVGASYENGDGVAQNYEEALKWYRRAADTGSGPGAVAVSHMYLFERGVAKNDEEAKKWYDRGGDEAAKEFANEVLFRLGGLPKRNEVGYSDDLEWLTMSSGGDYPDAISANAPWPADRQPDQSAIVAKLAAAADKGDADAINNLGLLYLNGVYHLAGTQAERWSTGKALLRKAAELGSAEALYNLGRISTNDRREERSLYRKAAEKGLPTAMYMMGQTAGYEPSDHTTADALEWFLRGARAGDRNSMFAAAWRYMAGDPGEPWPKDVPRDYAQALYWFRQAAEKGSHHAMGNLAVMYINGWGTRTDFAEAYFWARVADFAEAYSWAKVTGARRPSQSYAKAGDILAAKLPPARLKELDERVQQWIAAHKAAMECGTGRLPSCF